MSDASSLVERIRQQRSIKVPVGRWTFHARRPTDIEAGELYRERATSGAMAIRYVSGWEGLRMLDLVGGEDETPVEFDRAVWEEWVVDQPDVYKAIGDKIMEAYLEHAERQKADRKN